jgi:hypothetical protein
MTKQKVYCDRCRALITADLIVLDATTGPWHGQRHRIEICPQCLADLKRFLAGNDDLEQGRSTREGNVR